MRRVLVSTLFSCLVCVVAAAAALAQDDDPIDPTRPPDSPRETPARELTPEDRARRAKVVARVGEARITVGDVEDAVNEQSPFMRARYRDPAQLEAFVQTMIRFELLARAAERAEIGEDAEVERVVKQNAVQQLIRREFDERITPATVPADAVRQYYEAHPDEFSRPEMRRAAHVVVATREEADRLLAQAREADARAFRALARDHSQDPETRLRGGDLRYFDAEGRARNAQDPQIDEALAAAAFALEEVGDVGGPVAVGERFSIVKLTGRRPAEHRSLEQAEPTIRLRLWREQRQREMDEFVARLRREANVEIHAERMNRIRLDTPEREDEAEAEGASRAPRGATPTKLPGAGGRTLRGVERTEGAPTERGSRPAAPLQRRAPRE